MPRGRAVEIEQAQAAYPGAMTRGQLCDLLGLSHATVKRAIKDGRIPEAELTLPNGWRLWSREQVRTLLARKIERGRL